MRILLTNDDGIHAEGLAVLERIATQLSDDVWVVAPETDQSGLAHSLSLSEPLRMRKITTGAKRCAALTDTSQGRPQRRPSRLTSFCPASIRAPTWPTTCPFGHIAGAMEARCSASLHRAQPGLHGGRGRPLRPVGSRRDGRAAAAPADRDRPAGRRLPQHQFPNCRRPSTRPSSPARAKSTGCGSRSAGRPRLPYFWLRFGRDTSEIRDGTDMARCATIRSRYSAASRPDRLRDQDRLEGACVKPAADGREGLRHS